MTGKIEIIRHKRVQYENEFIKFIRLKKGYVFDDYNLLKRISFMRWKNIGCIAFNEDGIDIDVDCEKYLEDIKKLMQEFIEDRNIIVRIIIMGEEDYY